LEEVALQIFGSREKPGYQRWVDYWRKSRERNTSLLRRFAEIVLVDLTGKTVLDIGCGTGGLSEILSGQCERYLGIDYHRHVLQFAAPDRNSSFLQCDASSLPFPADTFDFIFAFDIVEHLESGRPQQRKFFAEIKRVLSPLGMLFLTTPNYWYPYDAHSDLCFPQLFPGFLRDKYIRVRNPDFLEEHGTFDAIHLLTPKFFQSALQESHLAPLHELPCCLDRAEYMRINPVRGALAYLGLGWYFHAEFWTIVVHREARSKLRRKLRNSWFYEKNQPAGSNQIGDFESSIDFDRGMFNHQLGPGWYWYERDAKGFRWTQKQATCYLQSREQVRYIHLSGFSPAANRFYIDVEGVRVGEHAFGPESSFEVKYLLPFEKTNNRIFEVTVKAEHMVSTRGSEDERELSLMIFSVGLS